MDHVQPRSGRLDMLAEVGRLDTLDRVLRKQRAEIDLRILRISREREHVQRCLAGLERSGLGQEEA